MDEIHIKEHPSPIKTPTQLVIVVVIAFLVPVFGFVMIAGYMTGGLRVDPKSLAMTEESVAQRLKPVGDVVIGETGAPTPATAAKPAAGGAVQSAAGPVRTAGGAADAKKTYDLFCAACHAAGVAGAPKTGDKASWKPRIAQGKDVLYTSAIKGKNLMPPKGGAVSLSDVDIKAAVDYLVNQAK